MSTPRMRPVVTLIFTAIVPLMIVVYCTYFALHDDNLWVIFAGIILGSGVANASWRHFHASD